MRLDDQSESQNVEDRARRRRRGRQRRHRDTAGRPRRRLFFRHRPGGDPWTGFEQQPQHFDPQHARHAKPPANDEMASFVAKVLGSTESDLADGLS
jgi:hypothetical protein